MDIEFHGTSFDEQLERIKLVTGKRTQIELANFFGVRQSVLSDAKRRGKIFSDWLVILMRVRNVSPEWILTGKGSCFMPIPPITGCYESVEAYNERKENEEALRRLPSRLLADELVRRIAVSQEKAFCSQDEPRLFEEKSKKK